MQTLDVWYCGGYAGYCGEEAALWPRENMGFRFESLLSATLLMCHLAFYVWTSVFSFVK